MRVEVYLEYLPTCPRCAALEKVVREVCNKLNIPFHMRLVGGAVVPHRSIASRTLERGWIERYASAEQKRFLRKVEPLVEMLASAEQAPSLIIRYYDGILPHEIVLKGFPPSLDAPQVREFTRNLTILLSVLKKMKGWR